MGARRTPSAAEPEELDARLRGLSPRWWSNGPGDRYGAHDHPYYKILYCSAGSIVFHTTDGDVELRPGDRLDLDPGTTHAATVGPAGVTCVEAQVPEGHTLRG